LREGNALQLDEKETKRCGNCRLNASNGTRRFEADKISTIEKCQLPSGSRKIERKRNSSPINASGETTHQEGMPRRVEKGGARGCLPSGRERDRLSKEVEGKFHLSSNSHRQTGNNVSTHGGESSKIWKVNREERHSPTTTRGSPRQKYPALSGLDSTTLPGGKTTRKRSPVLNTKTRENDVKRSSESVK